MQVLVVEDEPRMAELLKRTLSEDGHNVVVAADGRAGLEFARSSEFDVLVLDRMLPGIDGVAVIRKLREGRPNSSRDWTRARTIIWPSRFQSTCCWRAFAR